MYHLSLALAILTPVHTRSPLKPLCIRSYYKTKKTNDNFVFFLEGHLFVDQVNNKVPSNFRQKITCSCGTYSSCTDDFRSARIAILFRCQGHTVERSRGAISNFIIITDCASHVYHVHYFFNFRVLMTCIV